MQIRDARRAVLGAVLVGLVSCGGQSSPPPAPAATPQAPQAVPDEVDPADEAVPAPNARGAEVLAKLIALERDRLRAGRAMHPRAHDRAAAGSGNLHCPVSRRVSRLHGAAGDHPANYNGPWFQPHLIEQAHTGVPSGTRPWRNFDPRVESQRLAYLLTLRNYAFASAPVRSLTPQLTADSDYFDSIGGTVPAAQRSQKWYPAPRMTFGNPNSPGAREASNGLTFERTIPIGELGGNTAPIRNYAIAYYDARGARTYARVWSTATAGVDTPDRSKMKIAAGGLVYKLLYSAAKPADFPQDLLAGSLAAQIVPNSTGGSVSARLLQIDIAVKDDRAGPTGWYFATYAYDPTIAGSSPWLKMVPVGLMWGNDPAGLPLTQSWINPSAPAYAKAHLGVDGRLNGPVDNKLSACMSCHSTAQAPSLAAIVPPGSGACASQRAAWFRNIPGTQAFGRFDPEGSTCQTSLNGITLTAADYSLQLGSTVTRAVSGSATFNPCTWDDAAPPAAVSPAPPAPGDRSQKPAKVFGVARDSDR